MYKDKKIRKRLIAFFCTAALICSVCSAVAYSYFSSAEEGGDHYQDAKSIQFGEPVLNRTEDEVEFSLENLTDADKDVVVQIDHYKDQTFVNRDEYKLTLPSGTEQTNLSLPAQPGSRFTLADSTGSVYKDQKELGTYDWVGTWASSQLEAVNENAPPKPGLSGNTFRQFIRPSTGGEKIRLKFSNKVGKTPVELKSVHIANQVNAARSDIDPATDTVVTFDGSESVSIPAGGMVISDPVDYKVDPLQLIAVSTHFGEVPANITSHTGARCNNHFAEGNRVSDESLGNDLNRRRVSWYFLEGMDVMSPERNEAVVCFGDSITDGYGTNPNKYQRWTDAFAEKLLENEATSHLSVLNQGIGGNSIFGGLGQAAKDRFDHDVLEQPGAKYLVMLMGINDIGYATDESLTARMIEQYEIMIDKAHEKGIKVYMCTILPFKGNSYYSDNEGPLREKIRLAVNEWILTKSEADEVIDLSAAFTDPEDPEKMIEEFSNDWLHPNAAGYREIGRIVYEAMMKGEGFDAK